MKNLVVITPYDVLVQKELAKIQVLISYINPN